MAKCESVTVSGTWEPGNGIWGTSKLKNPMSMLVPFIITHLEVLGLYSSRAISAARYVGLTPSPPPEPTTRCKPQPRWRLRSVYPGCDRHNSGFSRTTLASVAQPQFTVPSRYFSTHCPVRGTPHTVSHLIYIGLTSNYNQTTPISLIYKAMSFIVMYFISTVRTMALKQG